MRSNIIRVVVSFAVACSSVFAFQTKTAQTGQPIAINEVVRRFAASESENRIARNNYAFTQDFDVMTIGEAGSVTGRFHRVSDIVLDDRGNRVERITFFPPPTLTELQITNEDMQDLAGVQPFALATEDLAKYQVDYVGKEKVDELTTYTFDVKPKTFVKGERYFQGRIWVDDEDLQIVKVKGQAVPEVDKQKFPHFESYRENIDSRFWFPTYIYVDDVLDFKKGPSVHLKMVVRFTNYKKFSSRIRVADEAGEAASEDDVKNAEKSKNGTPAVKPPDSQTKQDPKKPKKP